MPPRRPPNPTAPPPASPPSAAPTPTPPPPCNNASPKPYRPAGTPTGHATPTSSPTPPRPHRAEPRARRDGGIPACPAGQPSARTSKNDLVLPLCSQCREQQTNSPLP